MCTLFLLLLHQLHLRSSGFRPLRLGTPALQDVFYPVVNRGIPGDCFYPHPQNSLPCYSPVLGASRLGPGGSDSKESACSAGDQGATPGLGRSPGEGNGNPLQYSCLENPMGRGAWRATILEVAESDTTEQLTLSLSAGFPCGSVVKNLPASAGNEGSNRGSGRCPGEGNNKLLHSFCLGNPMDRGAWWATLHRVTKSQTGLKHLSMHAYTQAGNWGLQTTPASPPFRPTDCTYLTSPLVGAIPTPL